MTGLHESDIDDNSMRVAQPVEIRNGIWEV